MVLKRFYETKLAQASFLIGDPETGEGIVVDPNRDPDPYIEAAKEEHLQIKAVTETHIHADYVSGCRELAARTGATIYLSDEGDADWKYEFDGDANVRPVRDGDAIRLGSVRLDVKKTPGHTPEHIAFLVTNESASKEPMGALTGDFIFVGDVGRPDLLERAAGIQGTMESGARTLYRSLASFKGLPDSLLLLPGHGAGSSCGKNLSSIPVSTLGYEKSANWGLKAGSEEAFVSEVLAGQPEPPKYFKEMKRVNKTGPPILGCHSMPPKLAPDKLAQVLEEGRVVIDAREFETACAGYLPGTICIPFDSGFLTWCGWLARYDEPLYLIAEDQMAAAEAIRALSMIGLDDVGGWFGPECVQGAADLTSMRQIRAAEAWSGLNRGEYVAVDVRSGHEYSEGHIPGVPNIPLGYLSDRYGELPRDRKLVVHCQGGGRSPIGVTVLRGLGFADVLNMTDGFWEYLQEGLPVISGPSLN